MISLTSLVIGAHMGVSGQFSATAPEPSPTPTLRRDLDPLDVSPGFEGFVVTFLLVAVAIVLFLSMTRKMRRIRYKASKEELVSADLQGGHHDGDEVTGPADDGQ